MVGNLRSLGPGARHRFSAEVAGFGDTPGWRGAVVPVVLLRDVRLLRDGRRVAGRAEFLVGKGFQRLGRLERGDRIEFDARAVFAADDDPGGGDRPRWKLSHPSRVARASG